MNKEEKRIQALEAEGMTRSDAQGVYDAEKMRSCEFECTECEDTGVIEVKLIHTKDRVSFQEAFCPACCEHCERDHGICLDCGEEEDPGSAIDRAMDSLEDR